LWVVHTFCDPDLVSSQKIMLLSGDR
jgi:hypothetical protein